MTKEQAIMYLRSMQGICSPQDRMAKEAVSMAIEALSEPKHELPEYAEWKGAFDALSSPSGDLISRADAIEAVHDACNYCDTCDIKDIGCSQINALSALPSAEIAETDPIVIRSKTLLPTKDFKEWAKRVREENPNVIVIPCDAEVLSAEDVDIHKAHEEEHLNIVNRIKELQYAIAKTQTIVGKMVESAEAVQGEWIKTVGGNGWNEWYVFKCPLCGATIEDKHYHSWKYNFCPNCGAKMTKGGDSE